MTLNDEVVEAYRAGQAMRDQGGKITNNPYPAPVDGAATDAPGPRRAAVLRAWWSKGYQSRLPVVSYDG